MAKKKQRDNHWKVIMGLIGLGVLIWQLAYPNLIRTIIGIFFVVWGMTLSDKIDA